MNNMPVYLNRSHFDHMPDGSKNEWKAFHNPKHYELAADAFIPLFWSLLFSQTDLKHAKYIDQFDIDDAIFAEARQACLDEYADRQYPYFITTQHQALENLENRKAGLLKIFGQNLEENYSNFQKLIQNEFPEFIILRTATINLGDHPEEILLGALRPFEHLENTDQDQEFWDLMKKDLARYKDLNYFLQGISYSKQAPRAKKQFIANPHFTEEPKPKEPLETVNWIIAVFVSLATVAVWLFTHSVQAAFITFLILAIVLGFILIKLAAKK